MHGLRATVLLIADRQAPAQIDCLAVAACHGRNLACVFLDNCGAACSEHEQAGCCAISQRFDGHTLYEPMDQCRTSKRSSVLLRTSLFGSLLCASRHNFLASSC